MTPPVKQHIPFSDLTKELSDADVALFRGSGFTSTAIQVAGRSDYSNAALVGLVGIDLLGCPDSRVPMCIESREFVGVRAVSLASQVARYSGRVDVYRPGPAYGDAVRRGRIVLEGLRLTGARYGWGDIMQSSTMFLPGLRWLRLRGLPDVATPDLARHPAYCSAFVSILLRIYGGEDPVPNRDDRETLPGDLACTSALKYFATVYSDDDFARRMHEGFDS